MKSIYFNFFIFFNRKINLDIYGGSLLNPVGIDPNNTLQRRQGFQALAKFFTGKKKATLTIQTCPVIKLPLEYRQCLDYIAYSIIINTYAIPYVTLYRICMTDDFMKSENHESIFIFTSNNII